MVHFLSLKCTSHLQAQLILLETMAQRYILSRPVIQLKPNLKLINSFVYFANNSGYQGGAIVLVGMSSLYSSDNCYYYFWNNTATTLGGAICALTNNHLISSIYFDSCFLQLQNYKGIPKNISYYFHNNRASVWLHRHLCYIYR